MHKVSQNELSFAEKQEEAEESPRTQEVLQTLQGTYCAQGNKNLISKHIFNRDVF